MRLVAAFLLTFALGCGSDNTSTDAGLPHCDPTLLQGGTCSPSLNMPCVNASGLMCSCECGFVWICGDQIVCSTDMALPAHDLAHLGD